MTPTPAQLTMPDGKPIFTRVAALGALEPCPFCGTAAQVWHSNTLTLRKITCGAGKACPIRAETFWFRENEQAEYERRWNTRAAVPGSPLYATGGPPQPNHAPGCLHSNQKTTRVGAGMHNVCLDCGEVLA